MSEPAAPKSRVNLDVALLAISTDMDQMGEEIAGVAGEVATLALAQRETNLKIDKTNAKLDTLLDLIRERVLPQVDDVDNLRRRLVLAEDSLARVEKRTGSDAE